MLINEEAFNLVPLNKMISLQAHLLSINNILWAGGGAERIVLGKVSVSHFQISA